MNGHGVIAWRGWIWHECLWKMKGCPGSSSSWPSGAQLVTELFLVSWPWFHQLGNKERWDQLLWVIQLLSQGLGMDQSGDSFEDEPLKYPAGLLGPVSECDLPTQLSKREIRATPTPLFCSEQKFAGTEVCIIANN